MSGGDHNPGSELDLDAIEARARHSPNLNGVPAADAQRIVALREDVPALVAEVRHLRAQVGGMTEERSVLRDPCGCRREIGARGSCCFDGFTDATEERRLVTPWEPVE